MADNREAVEVRRIIVNRLPDNCGECPLMQYIDDDPVCCALPSFRWHLTGNPCDMTYRRSDCKMAVGNGTISLRGVNDDV